MLGIVSAGAVIATLFFLVIFILALFNSSIDGLKELIICSIIACVCIGAYISIDTFLYEDTTVKEYEVVSIDNDSFLYETLDEGVANKYMGVSNFKVYSSLNDRFYAIETTKIVNSKLGNAFHYFLDFSNELLETRVTYEIYMPEEKYQEYISN